MILFSYASPIGVGVNPAQLSFTDSAKQSLYVINTGEVEANYNVFSDNESIILSEKTFSLRPKESVEVFVRLSKPGQKFNATIFATASLASTNVSTGIKIPVTVSLSQTAFNEANAEETQIANITGFSSLLSNPPAFIGLILLIGILFTIAIIKFKQRRKTI